MKKILFPITRLLAIVLVASLFTPIFSFSAERPEKKELNENQKILHVLNRLGFGARPGDAERVRSMGLQKYIDQQLNADAIDDSAVESRLNGLEVFGMTTAEVFAKYPNPGALLRQFEGRNRRASTVNAPGTNDFVPAMDSTPNAGEQRERRRKLQAIYREYDLKPASQLMPQIVANRVMRAAYSEKQLQEVMVDFWQNHFNVFSGKAAVRWYIPSYERDVIRKNALGNFRDLLVGTAQHPAMLFFLDNFQSVSPGSQPANRRNNGPIQRAVREGNLTPQMRERLKTRQGLTDAQIDERLERAKANQQRAQQMSRRGLNENYARELMELHTLGVDGGYTQTDIVEVAKALTGWTIADPRGYRRTAVEKIKGQDDKRTSRIQRKARIPAEIESGEFYFNEAWHDKNSKTVLGQKINEGGVKDGLRVMDILVKHPSTAKFIARKLAVKFVSDNPSEALVGRVAEAFERSNGDIKTTLRAIFADKEFFAPENYRSKIKTPFELAVSSIRAVGAETNAGPAFTAMLNKLGEVPYRYQAPTGYPDTAEDWVNTGALLERLNFAVAVSSNRIPGTKVDLSRFKDKDKDRALDRAIKEILDGEISPATKATLQKQLLQPLPDVVAGDDLQQDEEMSSKPTARMNRRGRLLAPSGDPEVFKVVSLVLGSPEFQRQ